MTDKIFAVAIAAICTMEIAFFISLTRVATSSTAVA